MWNAITQPLDSRTKKLSVATSAGHLTVAETLGLLRTDGDFRQFMTGSLRGAGFDAFFWELPPITSASLAAPFECVLVEGDALRGLRPDPRPFDAHFRQAPAGQSVLTFPNLGGDAQLIVPVPVADSDACYPHLGAFLQGAPEEQVSELWATTGAVALDSASERPLWLSTAGLGVSWLHLRLDSRPKYYRHAAYKQAAPSGG